VYYSALINRTWKDEGEIVKHIQKLYQYLFPFCHSLLKICNDIRDIRESQINFPDKKKPATPFEGVAGKGKKNRIALDFHKPTWFLLWDNYNSTP